MKHLVYKTAVAVVAMIAAGSFASAGNAPLGMSAKPPSKPTQFSVTGITPSNIYFNASQASGGCALRNLAGCGFTVSGGPGGQSGYNGPAQAAKLYWAVLVGSLPAPSNSFTLLVALPQLKVSVITGVLIATTGDPCWGSAGTAIYKGSVPLSGIPAGTGNYYVKTVIPAPGTTSGQDPFITGGVFPAWEGVSLVLAGTGTGTVSLYDKGLPGEFVGSTNYTLFVQPSTTGFSRFDDINADGQIGPGITPQAGVPGKVLLLNGVEISGSNLYTPFTTAPNPNSDYDGSTGAPLPQLWDNEAHDISGVPVMDPITSAIDLNVVVNGGTDCLVTIAHVVGSSP
jgi:hypothetical protein